LSELIFTRPAVGGETNPTLVHIELYTLWYMGLGEYVRFGIRMKKKQSFTIIDYFIMLRIQMSTF